MKATTELDPRQAARLAEDLRHVATAAEPALERDELDVLDDAADFLEDAAGVETGERIMESPVTHENYRVTRWIEFGDNGAIALDKQPVDDAEVDAQEGAAVVSDDE